MSKVSISGDTNGTGNFTIKAPDSNTDRTLTLPDEAGSVLTNVSDIESQVKTATNATGSAPVYACRAWVNFDGTGTVSIRGSGNVSSITDGGTGRYTVNFATNLPNDNYSIQGTCVGINSNVQSVVSGSNVSDGLKVGSAQFSVRNSTSASPQDFAFVSVAVFR